MGNLFVAVGNAKLNSKMALYTVDQKVFVIKTIFTACGSCGEAVSSKASCISAFFFSSGFLPPSEIKQKEIFYMIKKQGLKCFDKLLFPLVRTAAFLEYSLFFFDNTDTKDIIDKYVELDCI